MVVERYDRARFSAGRVARIHQEDWCQALGLPSEQKYWTRSNDERRSLRTFARILDAYGGVEDVSRLAQVTAFHVAIGNADAHAKNHSLLLLPDGQVRLAPVYDAASTIQYATGPRLLGDAAIVSRALAIPVNGRTSVDDVTVDDLVAEARSWGLSETAATEAVMSVLARLPGAISESAGPHQDELVDVVSGRTADLAAGMPAGHSDPTLDAHQHAVASHAARRGRTAQGPLTGGSGRRARCGVLMPVAGTPCARPAGHNGPHRGR